MLNPPRALMGHYMTEQELTVLEYGHRTGNPVSIYGACYAVSELSKSISIFGSHVMTVEATLRELPPLGVPYPRRK